MMRSCSPLFLSCCAVVSPALAQEPPPAPTPPPATVVMPQRPHELKQVSFYTAGVRLGDIS